MDHRLLPEPERLLAVLDQIGADFAFRGNRSNPGAGPSPNAFAIHATIDGR